LDGETEELKCRADRREAAADRGAAGTRQEHRFGLQGGRVSRTGLLGGRHDDQVDSTSQALEWADQLRLLPTPRIRRL
jgi:hypothetical protein